MKKWTPCDDVNENGEHICPYAADYSGYDSEMCRVCCGLGVDGDEDDDFEDDEDWELNDDELELEEEEDNEE